MVALLLCEWWDYYLVGCVTLVSTATDRGVSRQAAAFSDATSIVPATASLTAEYHSAACFQ